MKMSFRLRGQEIALTYLQGVVAVQPSQEFRQRAKQTRSKMIERFGSTAKDDSTFRGTFGLALPEKNRKLFERAGWLFVEPQANVARAADVRTRIDDADAVRPVLIDRSGGVLVTTDLVTVQLAPDVPEAEVKAILRSDQLKLERQLKFSPNTYEVHLPTRKPLAEAIQELQASPNYLFAEPVLLQPIVGRLRPTDPHFGRQWQHTNDGSNGGTAGADIRSEAAWDLTLGRRPDRPVRIAVIDNGFHVNHPDLRDGIVGGGFYENTGSGATTFVRYQPGDS